MTKSTTLKKILPAILIVAILATGFFGVFGVGVVNAQTQTSQSPSTLGTVGKFFGTLLFTGGTPLWSENCGFTNLPACAAVISEQVLEVTGWILWLSGTALNKAVDITVIKMGENVNKITAITEGWKIFRDLANIVLIFILLFIGIATILRLEKYNTKKLLVMLITVALLINFSLFFTKVIVDASNILAHRFHQQIEKDGEKLWKKNSKSGEIQKKWSGIADSYMQALTLSTIYDIKQKEVTIRDQNQWSSAGQIVLIGLLGAVLFIITSFIFFAATFLLVMRFVVLLFLMALSPLAFIGMILPATAGYARRWWDTLFHYALFAPAFFLLTLFVVKVIGSDGFRAGIGLTNASTYSGAPAGAPDTAVIILNFIIVIVFAILSLLIAKWMGIAGSNVAISWGQSARKWGQGFVAGTPGRFARNTIGRGASKMASSEKLKERAAQSGMKGTFNRMYLRGLQGVAGSSLDFRSVAGKKGMGELGKGIGKGGYEEKLKQQIKAREKFAESLGKESIAEKQRKGVLKEETKSATDIFAQAQEKEKQARIDVEQAKLPEYKKIAQEKLKKATSEKEAADALLKAAKFAEAAFKPGVERQKSYAGALEKEKTIDTVFIKVPRKGKEAAQKIRDNIDKFKEKKILDSLKEAIEKEGEPKPEEETES